MPRTRRSVGRMACRRPDIRTKLTFTRGQIDSCLRRRVVVVLVVGASMIWGVASLATATPRTPSRMTAHAALTAGLARPQGRTLRRSPATRAAAPGSPEGPAYSTCFVAEESCSIVPCVEFVRGTEPVPTVSPSTTLGATSMPPGRTCGTRAYPQVGHHAEPALSETVAPTKTLIRGAPSP